MVVVARVAIVVVVVVLCVVVVWGVVVVALWEQHGKSAMHCSPVRVVRTFFIKKKISGRTLYAPAP